MIGAFGRIGGAEKVAPQALANDISLALWATGSGLLIATPLMIVGNDIHARLRQLRDRTERHLQDFLEVLEDIENHGLRPRIIAREARPRRPAPLIGSRDRTQETTPMSSRPGRIRLQNGSHTGRQWRRLLPAAGSSTPARRSRPLTAGPRLEPAARGGPDHHRLAGAIAPPALGPLAGWGHLS